MGGVDYGSLRLAICATELNVPPQWNRKADQMVGMVSQGHPRAELEWNGEDNKDDAGDKAGEGGALGRDPQLLPPSPGFIGCLRGRYRHGLADEVNKH